MTVALGLASASLADEAEQWAPATYETTGPTAAAATIPASAPGGTEYNAQYHYPQTPAQVRADPNGQLAAASMVRSMRDSLADISGRVGRGFSSIMGGTTGGESTTRVSQRHVILLGFVKSTRLQI